MHYYPHHIGDFLRDTVSLTPQESYFYLRLIWLYYESEKPLPNDTETLAFKVGARGQEDCLSLLLRTFFRYDSDLNSYTHQRIDAEIRKYQRKAESARGANQIRWTLEKDKKSDLNSDTDQILTNNQQPITNNHIEAQQEKPASKEKKRGTRLSEDWQPDEKLIQFAKEKRPDLNLNDTVRMFKNYWVAKTRDATKLDWNLTFENWVMNQKASYAKQVAQPTASAYGDRASL
jgi:uncharacterized protein YdaU (DUF1376 family)